VGEAGGETAGDCLDLDEKKEAFNPAYLKAELS
jgi:hypothetical protein